MYFTYLLRSEKDKSYYTGITSDLRRRLDEHNSGTQRYSRARYPFKLVWFCAFPKKSQALEFESYLKTGSGIAFRNKHLL
ncbi:MAG: GIY-YIG nuclease family protein [Patescibacteria group bacterium]